MLSLIKSVFNKTNPKCICNAPYASMYFRPDGSVTPCCFNTSYVYGKYPENSIKEIWQGSPIKEFRKLMINNDLSHGCHICEKHINSNNIEAAGLQHFKNLQIDKNNPVKFELELSHQCNLSCIMCFQPKVKSTAIVYDNNFIEQVTEFLPFIKTILFLGGEPFVIELYYQLWEVINETNPECINNIQTNGTIWNERVKNIIQHGRYHISISLDSVDESIYKSIRTNARLYHTLENVNLFNNYMKLNNEKLSIAVCPMRNNAYNIPDIFRFAAKINANVFFHTVFYPPKLSLIYLNKKDLELILKFYQHFLTDFKDFNEQNKKSFLILFSQIKTFIKNWEKAEKLVVLNKEFDKCFYKCMNYLEQFLGNEEKLLLKDKLYIMFSGIIKTFPVVYGINQILRNNDGDFLMNLIRDKNDQELLDVFICYTLFSIE